MINPKDNIKAGQPGYHHMGQVVNKQGLVIYTLNLKININERILKKLAEKPLIKLLDFGCGQGFALNDIAKYLSLKEKLSSVELYGIDANKQGTTHKFMYVVEDVQKYDFPVKFDIIVSHQTLQYIPNQLAILEKIYSWLAINGEAHIYLPRKVMFVEKNGSLKAFEDSDLLKDFIKTKIVTITETKSAITLHMKKSEFFPEIVFRASLKGAPKRESNGKYITTYVQS